MTTIRHHHSIVFLSCILATFATTLLPGCAANAPEENQSEPVAEPMHIQDEPSLPISPSDDTPEPTEPTSPPSQESQPDSTIDDPQSTPPPEATDDGFPTGQSTPEGAACDLARAFMTADSELLKATCLPLTRGDSGAEYTKFIEEMVEMMDSMQGRPLSEMGAPKELAHVFQARHLTATGPASYGFASLGLNDIQFVDVVVTMWDGSTYTNRTLVLQASNANWYAMPRPDLFPLLSRGLNAESDSTTAWDD